MTERDKLLVEEIDLLASLYRKKASWKRNRGWKEKRYRAIAYGLEKAHEIVERYGRELDLNL